MVPRSTIEAEYKALASCVCEVIWILNLLKEFGMDNKRVVPIFCDSLSVVEISKNPTFHERTKHFDLDLHFVREKVHDKVEEINHVRSYEQLANLLTL